ncbi:hypothetical protein MRX96_034314 [Rhipicephalus microplus]
MPDRGREHDCGRSRALVRAVWAEPGYSPPSLGRGATARWRESRMPRMRSPRGCSVQPSLEAGANYTLRCVDWMRAPWFGQHVFSLPECICVVEGYHLGTSRRESARGKRSAARWPLRVRCSSAGLAGNASAVQDYLGCTGRRGRNPWKPIYACGGSNGALLPIFVEAQFVRENDVVDHGPYYLYL